MWVVPAVFPGASLALDSAMDGPLLQRLAHVAALPTSLALATSLAAAGVHADRPYGPDAADQAVAERQAMDRARQSRERANARFHAHSNVLPDASTPDTYPPHLDPRSALPVRTDPPPVRVSYAAATGSSAEEYYEEHVSPIVQSRCIACHVDGGASGNTRLVFVPESESGHLAANRDTFADFLEAVEDGAGVILNKVQGVAHGGGIQLPAGSEGYAHLETFLGLLGEESARDALSPETLFDTVRMAPNLRTFRRAAIVFAGRYPTPKEEAALRSGRVPLRAAIRGLMQGPGFHDFLLRAANDRLLTDGVDVVVDPNFEYFVRYAEKMHQCRRQHGADCWGQRWVPATQFGLRAAPLELIARIAEQDLPYTEILTADYVMANPFADDVYGPSAEFDDPDDPFEFRPSRITSYYRNDDTKVTEYTEAFGLHVVDPGNLRTDIPHAGILNTNAFLARYPSTATNRNRARSRWTYYHFLGLDVEKSAPRTTDPEALADTDNPTLNNPACTVCHTVLDPVAGAYQNYGDEGYYRDKWGGLDSLDDFYKSPPDGSDSPYVEGDTWYRDMRPPGFDGAAVPDADASLPWLASRLVADDRFARAAVRFWWPAVMGAPVADPPEDAGDADFAGRLLASNAQAAEVGRLARRFRRGVGGNPAYNLKDLLTEIALSRWFRAEAATDDDPVRRAALRHAGAERLLTPEELTRKTAAATGVAWGRRLPDPTVVRRGTHSALDDAEYGYRLLYGGIDSRGVTERATDMTALMAGVSLRHAADLARIVVLRELYLLEDGERRLFDGVDVAVNPAAEHESVHAVEALWPATETVLAGDALTGGTKLVVVRFLNGYWDEAALRGRHVWLDRLDVRDADGRLASRVELEELEADPADCAGIDGHALQLYACEGVSVRIEVDVPDGGRIDIVAGGEAFEGLPELAVAVETEAMRPASAAAVKRKLAELHRDLLGLAVSPASTDVAEAFDLFEAVWQRKRARPGEPLCGWPEEQCLWDIDHRFFEGIADGPLLLWIEDEPTDSAYWEWDWARAEELVGDTPDPHGLARTWAVVLALLLGDHRYIHL